jgi:hypothetical protein
MHQRIAETLMQNSSHDLELLWLFPSIYELHSETLYPSARRLMIHTQRANTVIDMHASEQHYYIITRCLFWAHPSVRREGGGALSCESTSKIDDTGGCGCEAQAAPVLINPLKIIYYSFVL